MSSGSSEWVHLAKHYNGAFVFLAYVIAVAGSWSTVELLLKRTGNNGWFNVMLLVGAGIAFGSTSTWGMHFVGNQALSIHIPGQNKGISLSYGVGYTMLSLVVAVLAMILAFAFIGLRFDSRKGHHGKIQERESQLEKFDPEGQFELEPPPAPEGHKIDEALQRTSTRDGDNKRFSWNIAKGSSTVVDLPGKRPRPNSNGSSLNKPSFDDGESDDVSFEEGGDFGVNPAGLSIGSIAKILVAGIISGGGVAGMHYVGQLSINSVPRIRNKAYMVVLSILIAMIAVSTALYLLFAVLRPKLQHSWYKRLGVAMLLAVATTLMHFVALMGTEFYLPVGEALSTPSSGNKSKTLIIVLVSVLAPVCCLTLLVVAYIAQQRLVRQIASRHRIVLAVAIFDSNGHLLVNHEDGLLPSAQIYPVSTSQPQKASFLEWLGVKDKLSLDGSKKLARSDPAFVAFLRASWSWKERSSKDVLTSKLTAEQLAEQVVDLDEEDAGDMTVEQMRRAVVGFEIASQEIAGNLIGTPNVKVNGILFDSILKTGHFQVASKQSGDKFTVTQGQLLVLTRRLRSQAEREALLARGYMFAEPKAVARSTSSAFAVPVDRTFEYFRHVHQYSRYGTTRRVDRGRLYGGVLILQAQPGEGLHVVVDAKQHHALPMLELAALVDNPDARPKLPPSTLPTTTLASVTEAMHAVAGKTLLDLVRAEGQWKQGQAPQSHGSQMRSVLVNLLRPFLDRTLSPECMAFLLPRLVVTPHIIPLTDRGAPHVGADGILSDSFLVCLKAVIPSAIILPGPPLEWLPFALYKAQSECITRATGLRQGLTSKPGTAAGEHQTDSYASPSVGTASPQQAMSFPPSSGGGASGPFDATHNKRGSTYSASENEDDEASGGPSSLAGFSNGSPSVAGNRERDPNRPGEIPAYDEDWVLGLVKTTIAPQGGNGYWGEVSDQQLHGAARKGRTFE